MAEKGRGESTNRSQALSKPNGMTPKVSAKPNKKSSVKGSEEKAAEEDAMVRIYFVVPPYLLVSSPLLTIIAISLLHNIFIFTVFEYPLSRLNQSQDLEDTPLLSFSKGVNKRGTALS